LIKKFKLIFEEYPKPFWVMMLGMFIDSLGVNFIYPFFALFVTARFGVGLTEVGLMLGAMTAGNIIGGLIGGSLADRYGRKIMILSGLLISGLFSISIIFITRFEMLFFAAVMVGLLGSLGGPASRAMLVDLLPEQKITSGFGVLRVVFNLSVAIGPLIGGFVSDYSFNWLFIGDAITSAITFFIVLKYLKETKPDTVPAASKDPVPTPKGYLVVLKDKNYIFLLIVIMLSFAVLLQMLSTLSVYMRDVHSFPNKYYGYILSLNAAMVVVMQFWVSRKADKIPPLLAMVIGSFFITIGYSMFGFVKGIMMFALAMAVLTIGEMVIDPMSQSLAARLAPLDMRARYLAVLGFSVTLSNLFTPYLAGLLIDNYDPNWIWYSCGIIGILTMAGYSYLHFRFRSNQAMAAAPEKS
jgi:MFS family permease